ncbi:hypothetical protein [Pragia fontium]|uniref:hypothetical protein n=1 Tax=Pragia fontium TaxID=82985 RepID=UPI00064A99A1|nr:hypothetical protein [Pragia fontium]AKJ41802.1 hypothetical protein QQ39_06660 [Pragia fontium]
MSKPSHEFLTGLATTTVLSYIISTLNEDQKQSLLKLAEKKALNFQELSNDTTSKEEMRIASETVNDIIEDIIKTGCGQE